MQNEVEEMRSQEVQSSQRIVELTNSNAMHKQSVAQLEAALDACKGHADELGKKISKERKTVGDKERYWEQDRAVLVAQAADLSAETERSQQKLYLLPHAL
jgi:hypothetical protein